MDLKNAGKVFVRLPPLHKAEFIARLNRFVAEVKLNGRVYRAHVPSSGRMKELLYPGAFVYVANNAGVNRKTDYRILLAENNGKFVSVDSLLPNRLIRRALEAGVIDELPAYGVVRPEARYGGSRFDFFLSGEGWECFLEVKSVTLVVEGVALFPDAPSARGARHLEELAHAVREGKRGVVMFVVQREDASTFSPNDAGDPLFGEALRRAAAAGVEVLAVSCKVEKTGVYLNGAVQVNISNCVTTQAIKE